MSDGELKKRMVRGIHIFNLHNPENLVNEMFEIIDKAKKEYPTEKNTFIPPYFSHVEGTLLLTSKRQEWFLRLFGELE